MKPTTIVYGVVSGIVGAALWAFVASASRMEFSFMAIIVGAIVGFSVVAGGGHGANAAMLALVVTICAICIGKVGSINLLIEDVVTKKYNSQLSQEEYNKLVQNAELFSKIQSENEYPRFMFERKLTKADSIDKITANDINEFKQYDIPILKEFNTNKPEFTKWKEQEVKKISDYYSKKYTFAEKLKMTMGIKDIIFFVIAIIAAVSIPMQGEEEA